MLPNSIRGADLNSIDSLIFLSTAPYHLSPLPTTREGFLRLKHKEMEETLLSA